MSQVTKYTIGVLILTATASLIWWENNQDSSQEEIVIGALLPLTGNGAADGQWGKRGIELAEEEINKNNPDQKIRVVFEDTKGEVRDAVNAYNGLKSKDKLHAIITWGSGIGLALTPLANNDHIVQVGIATSTSDYSTPHDFTFRNFPIASDEAEFITTILQQSLRVKQIAVVKLNNDYGVAVAKNVTRAFEATGEEVITEETLNLGETDFRTQIENLKRINPKVIFLASYPKEAGLFLKQAYEVGLRAQVIASSAIVGNEIINIAKAGAEGLIMTIPSKAFTTEVQDRLSQFAQMYSQEFGEEFGPEQVLAIRAYDVVHLLTPILVGCNTSTNPQCSRQELENMGPYDGLGGQIAFDLNGDLKQPNLSFLIIKNGKFMPYETTK